MKKRLYTQKSPFVGGIILIGFKKKVKTKKVRGRFGRMTQSVSVIPSNSRVLDPSLNQYSGKEVAEMISERINSMNAYI